MTATLIRRSSPGADRHPMSLFGDLGGEPTLDELVVGVWEGLTAQRTSACPVCRGPMEPEYGTHARLVGGRCHDCGSSLS